MPKWARIVPTISEATTILASVRRVACSIRALSRRACPGWVIRLRGDNSGLFGRGAGACSLLGWERVAAGAAAGQPLDHRADGVARAPRRATASSSGAAAPERRISASASGSMIGSSHDPAR